MMDRYRALKL
jgi:hypothetical protein